MRLDFDNLPIGSNLNFRGVDDDKFAIENTDLPIEERLSNFTNDIDKKINYYLKKTPDLDNLHQDQLLFSVWKNIILEAKKNNLINKQKLDAIKNKFMKAVHLNNIWIIILNITLQIENNSPNKKDTYNYHTNQNNSGFSTSKDFLQDIFTGSLLETKLKRLKERVELPYIQYKPKDLINLPKDSQIKINGEIYNVMGIVREGNTHTTTGEVTPYIIYCQQAINNGKYQKTISIRSDQLSQIEQLISTQ